MNELIFFKRKTEKEIETQRDHDIPAGGIPVTSFQQF